jgi:putative tryptophan/tyrosine transport system substrate-binding protein
MRRREFIALIGVSLTWPAAAPAQQSGKIYRLGFLLPLSRDAPVNVAFFDELRNRGLIVGQNLEVEYRAYGSHPELISQYAAELVKARVDVIVTGGSGAVRALQEATKTIPIVGIVSDMVLEGFVSSLARPNGNITGVNILSFEAEAILIEAVHGLRRMGILADVNFATDAKIDELQEAARSHDVELSIHRVARAEEIVSAIDNAQASGCTALHVLSSPLFYTHRQTIMDHATAARLPTIYEFPETAEEGGFTAYGPRMGELFLKVMPRQLLQLLQGIKVADVPVEQPTHFELVINLKAANAMGLKVPPSLLLRADKVIE